jgi:hypothetical protein
MFSQTRDPEAKPNPEPAAPGMIDPFAPQRDHANQWDVSAIWLPQSDSKSDPLDWEHILKEAADQ